MEITYVVIVSIVTYVLGAITKLFIEFIPNRYSYSKCNNWCYRAIICYLTKIEPNLLQSIILCLMASTAAGGVAELVKVNSKRVYC